MSVPAFDNVGLSKPKDMVAVSGLEFLCGIIAGQYPAPPFSRATKIWLTEAREGFVKFSGQPEEGFFNPLGTIHGGWSAAILDSAMGCAVHTMLKPGFSYTTVEMKLNYVRAVMPGRGLVTCEGRIVHSGSRIATSEGFLRDAEGKLLAHGTETCMILDLRDI